MGEPVYGDALGLGAGTLEGAYAVAVGEAVWRSARDNRLVAIRDLLPATSNPYTKGTP